MFDRCFVSDGHSYFYFFLNRSGSNPPPPLSPEFLGPDAQATPREGRVGAIYSDHTVCLGHKRRGGDEGASLLKVGVVKVWAWRWW